MSVDTYVDVSVLNPELLLAMRNEFSGHMHKFLARLTDAQHKVVGHTVLYIPDEGSMMEAKEAHTDKDLVQRLEG